MNSLVYQLSLSWRCKTQCRQKQLADDYYMEPKQNQMGTIVTAINSAAQRPRLALFQRMMALQKVARREFAQNRRRLAAVGLHKRAAGVEFAARRAA